MDRGAVAAQRPFLFLRGSLPAPVLVRKDSVWLYQTEIPGDHEQDEQSDRHSDPPRQRPDDAICFSVIADQVAECGTETDNDG